MPYSYKYSADIPFKIKTVGGLALYGKGSVVALGPEIPGSKAYLWKANPANDGIQNLESGKYITAEGTLGDIPQDWDLISVGGDDYNIKIPGTEKAVTIAGEATIALPLGADVGQAFKLEFQL
ncbi:hypothetical protein F5I97DRAFT_1927013 [Phlebopus sp. FC_14]|nr:hypothetical protein F5I97DRAFT_1927013 [Phlebopus sp. FC_14]